MPPDNTRLPPQVSTDSEPGQSHPEARDVAHLSIPEPRVWAFHYDLYDSDGNKIESSKAGPPVLCLEGERGVLVTLQEALSSKKVGDQFSITIPHGKAYGRHYPNRVQRLSRKKIDGGKQQSFRVGQIITLQSDHGPSPATVIKVGRFNLDVDMNHPLAGVDLTFEVSVEAIRTATEDEIAHGHAHGVGGHQHD